MQAYTFLKVFFVLILNLQEYRTEIEVLKRNLKNTVLPVVVKKVVDYASLPYFLTPHALKSWWSTRGGSHDDACWRFCVETLTRLNGTRIKTHFWQFSVVKKIVVSKVYVGYTNSYVGYRIFSALIGLLRPFFAFGRCKPSLHPH